MRLDQFISQTSILSRRDAKVAIKRKRVMVNEQVNRDHSFHISEADTIYLDQQLLAWPKELYYMLNKPAGFCCSHEDDGYPSALTLLPETVKKLHFAGRLDAETTGLVLLSSDGSWCHRIASPKQKVRKSKHYLFDAAYPISDDNLQQLRDGVLLNGEKNATLPARASKISELSYMLVIQEGKYHQVRRMLGAIGNKVTALHRQSIGAITLDKELSAGQYRELTAEEVNAFNE